MEISIIMILPYKFKSGRASLLHILHAVKPSLVYIPYYTCDALLEPFITSGVPFRFYEIDLNMEPINPPSLSSGEYFLYVNYLDIKRDTVARLSEQYADKLIVDCSQAFFMKGKWGFLVLQLVQKVFWNSRWILFVFAGWFSVTNNKRKK
jgi:hypothetical protein